MEPNENEISFWDLVPEMSPEIAEKLFPEFPEDYFTPDNPGIEKRKPGKPESNPFVAIVDLNEKDPTSSEEEIRPKRAVEIGWEWKF